MSKQEPKR